MGQNIASLYSVISDRIKYLNSSQVSNVLLSLSTSNMYPFSFLHDLIQRLNTLIATAPSDDILTSLWSIVAIDHWETETVVRLFSELTDRMEERGRGEIGCNLNQLKQCVVSLVLESNDVEDIKLIHTHTHTQIHKK
eukprot:GHVR01032861.1.p1 GENE.GHVR01032861.1~~GHVR01032861.1.p1  ORF type:complete len:137 (+),score=36.76 GHVR01032861.1:75-485(+)